MTIAGMLQSPWFDTLAEGDRGHDSRGDALVIDLDHQLAGVKALEASQIRVLLAQAAGDSGYTSRSSQTPLRSG